MPFAGVIKTLLGLGFLPTV